MRLSWKSVYFVLAGLSLLYAIRYLDQRLSYVLTTPEVIAESVNGTEAPRQVAKDNELAAVIAQRHDEIFNDPDSPVGANPKGSTNLAELFDYNCNYCRQAAPMLAGLERDDRDLRVVFKQNPVFGPDSVFAARAALASRKQGKFLALHEALMAHPGPVTQTSTLEIAARLGLDLERLKKDMEDPAVDEEIKRTRALARDLHLFSVPSFVIGKEIVHGARDADEMKRLIKSAQGL
ncbi:DsbA family protein (plasmid) [Sinorhizobium numidicum]|uniref:DsbA family protein n=1 Tax=Sinorhizobium numidicum TaxID=680248 RepID=A0ABY8D6R2_9HYPH|nr:DsbA family protein [Sinorhizobium numidicum]WEX79649.1 DsbA family protein [Sinorhizobium numidicum]WEX85397.1 DsbA family protein [Sinorhizobium numidicum]